MSSPNIPIPLHIELETLLRVIQAEQMCIAKSTMLSKCSNKINKKSRKRIAQLFEEVIIALQSGVSVNEELLREASSLVMCTRRHQGLAAMKFEDWCKKIEDINLGDEPSPSILEKPSSSSIAELLDDFGSLEIDPESSNMGRTAQQEVAQSDSCSISEPSQVSIEYESEDSGLGLNDEDRPIEDLPQVLTNDISLPPASATPSTPPATSKKPLIPPKFDSGISMSNEKFVLNEPLDGSESPTAAKAQRSKHAPFQKPDMPAASAPSHKTSLEPEFYPFSDPLKTLKNYIKKPLPPTHTLDGYIYCFLLEGTNKSKIGFGLPRSRHNEQIPISLEESFAERMDEHKDEWGSAPEVVLHLKVPYAGRIEKIIHYHLEKGRMKVPARQKGSEKKKKKISVHGEWFNNSLPEITKVMKAWSHWSLMMPYVELKKEGKSVHCLNAHWQTCLQGLNSQPFRDNWFHWLHQHVPEVGRHMPLSDKELIEKERSVHGSRVIVRSNAMGERWPLKRNGTAQF